MPAAVLKVLHLAVVAEAVGGGREGGAASVAEALRGLEVDDDAVFLFLVSALENKLAVKQIKKTNLSVLPHFPL